MKPYDFAVFGLLAVSAVYMIMHYEHDAMHVPPILMGILGYLYAARRHHTMRVRAIFTTGHVCLFGVCMAHICGYYIRKHQVHR